MSRYPDFKIMDIGEKLHLRLKKMRDEIGEAPVRPLAGKASRAARVLPDVELSGAPRSAL